MAIFLTQSTTNVAPLLLAFMMTAKSFYPAFALKAPKKPAMPFARSSGSSGVAKWPPCGISVQR
jgi:hypothetical protein